MVICRADGIVVCPIRVGDILMTDTASNPNTTYTGTTWQQVCVGRVPVGVNTSDSDFNTINKTGGAKSHSHTTGSHTLTIAEMPIHCHGIALNNTTGNPQAWFNDWSMIVTYAGQVHPAGNRLQCNSTDIGGNQAHNHGATESASNQMLYQTKYFWKRLS